MFGGKGCAASATQAGFLWTLFRNVLGYEHGSQSPSVEHGTRQVGFGGPLRSEHAGEASFPRLGLFVNFAGEPAEAASPGARNPR